LRGGTVREKSVRNSNIFLGGGREGKVSEI